MSDNVDQNQEIKFQPICNGLNQLVWHIHLGLWATVPQSPDGSYATTELIYTPLEAGWKLFGKLPLA